MILDLKVTRRQRAFIEARADEVLFGGAAGGGKSYGQLIDALVYALRYPGSKQLLLRRTYPDLERSLVLEHLKIFPLRHGYSYNSSTHRGAFANGSRLEFGYCDSEKDVYRYQGAEYDVIRFDELTHFTEFQYLYLLSRLRGVTSYPRSVRSSTNPGGVGHAWVKERFVDIGPPDQVHRVVDDRGNASTRIFLPSRITDNRPLMKGDPDYLNRLERLPERERKALLNGEWDLTDGQYFAEFRRDRHVYRPDAVELPAHWRRFVAIDYGMDMLAAYWIALSPARRAYVYREVYEGRDNGMGANGRGHIASAAARRLREETPKDETIYSWLAPPDLWNRNRDTGRSTAEIFSETGVMLTPASNDRVHGWRAVHEWLADITLEDGSSAPALQISESCPNLIRCLPALQYDSRNPEDAAKDPHEITHAPDALRAFCVTHASPAAEPEKETHTLEKAFNLGRHPEDVLGKGDEIHVL